MSDIATRQFDLKREYLQQKLWKNFDTWLVVRIAELEAQLEVVSFRPALDKEFITELRDMAEKWRSTTGLFIKDPDTRATTVKAFRICANELEAAIGEQE